MEKIFTANAPAAIGPYSQAMKVGGLIFTSGQLGIDPDTGNLLDGIEQQAEQACKNVAAVLAEGGSAIENVVKTTCFLSSMDDFAAFNSVYAKYFTSNPARSCVAVKTLPKGGLVEIEAIAEI